MRKDRLLREEEHVGAQAREDPLQRSRAPGRVGLEDTFRHHRASTERGHDPLPARRGERASHVAIHDEEELVSHGHIEIDGRRVNVPSIQVRPGQTIGVRERSRGLIPIREALEITPDPPPYLYRNKDEMQGTLSRYPERQEIPLPVDVEERLIVEFYS